VTKEITSRLIKYIKVVDIKFNPFDTRTASAREVWNQLASGRFKTANPKMSIGTHILSTPDAPHVNFIFANDTTANFDSQNYDAKEIMDEVWMRTSQIEVDYELENRSIDDEM